MFVRLLPLLAAMLICSCGDSDPECVPECSEYETRCTDATNFQTCERESDDPCSAEWGDETPGVPMAPGLQHRNRPVRIGVYFGIISLVFSLKP